MKRIINKYYTSMYTLMLCKHEASIDVRVGIKLLPTTVITILRNTPSLHWINVINISPNAFKKRGYAIAPSIKPPYRALQLAWAISTGTLLHQPP